MPSYIRQVIDGSLGYDIHPPFIPGPACIGQVESIGADVFDLSVGDVVLCNSLLSSGEGAGPEDQILIGWTGSGTGRSGRMQQFWPNGSFAQMAHYPARCLTVLPEAEKWDRKMLPFLASLAIANGGLRRGGLEAGQTVVINGASGQLGGAAVLLALAHGAARVVATGPIKDLSPNGSKDYGSSITQPKGKGLEGHNRSEPPRGRCPLDSLIHLASTFSLTNIPT